MTAAGSDGRRDTWREDLDRMEEAFRYAQGYDVAGWEGHLPVWNVRDVFEPALARVAGELERLEQEVARLCDGLRRIEGHFGANEYEDCTHKRRGWRHSDCLTEIRIEARSLLSGGQADSTKEQG